VKKKKKKTTPRVQNIRRASIRPAKRGTCGGKLAPCEMKFRDLFLFYFLLTAAAQGTGKEILDCMLCFVR